MYSGVGKVTGVAVYRESWSTRGHSMSKMGMMWDGKEVGTLLQ